MEPRTFRGYMIEATLAGGTLTLHGTTKPARIALAGQDHETDPVVELDAITATDWKPASVMTNGRLTVHAGHRSWVLHFRRKQQGDMEELARTLDALRT